jgi:hypothetical protein
MNLPCNYLLLVRFLVLSFTCTNVHLVFEPKKDLTVRRAQSSLLGCAQRHLSMQIRQQSTRHTSLLRQVSSTNSLNYTTKSR